MAEFENTVTTSNFDLSKDALKKIRDGLESGKVHPVFDAMAQERSSVLRAEPVSAGVHEN